MKIALIQMDIQWEEKKRNFKKAEKFIQEASERGCNIAVFPEMFATGFTMNISSIGEPFAGETQHFLSHMAKQNRMHIIAGFAEMEKGNEKGRNVAVIYSREGEMIAKYTKLHPFSFAHEGEYYIAGDDVVIFSIDGIQSSIFICYDLRFPEIFRKVANRVKVMFVIANWPTARKDHWEALLKARAIENQCFVIGVNRTGADGNSLRYSGASCIYNPLGNSICKGGETEEMVVCEFDPNETDKVRSQFGFLRDIRFLEHI